MQLAASRPRLPITPFILSLSLLLASCIKEDDYNLLLKQKQGLEHDLQAAQQQVLQEQAATKATQARLMELINIQSSLHQREQELKDTQKELEALKAEFAKFRSERRGAMIKKKYPQLSLDSGKTLTNAEIASVDATHITFQHDDGFVKLALADSNAELRWEACYNPEEARRLERDRFLSDARAVAERLEEARRQPEAPAAPDPAGAERNLRSALAAQRTQLNSAYAALKAANPASFKNVSWNSTKPETSPMLTSLSSRPAVLGLSRLDGLRAAINESVAALRALGVSNP